ncbi:MAG TPA: hypothetical protein VFS51_02125 [Gemmatimonadales bacterium]|nr:hypothetical protein [Gemmatimonadales bacterium]
MRRRQLAFYPFLAAVYSVLVLAAENRDALSGLGELVRPSAVMLLVAGLAWLLAAAVVRDSHRRALITLVVVAYFAGFKALTRGIRSSPWLEVWDAWRYADALSLILLLGIVTLVLRGRRPLNRATGFLNLTASILVLFPAVLLVRFGVTTAGPPIVDAGPIPQPRAMGRRDSTPDIYLIILDKYTGSRSLQANYAFDNTPFERFLRSRGFVVPSRAQANYVHTFLALASLLNWRYLDDLPERFGRDRSDWSLAYPLIEDSRTVRFLASRGYRFVFFPTAFAATRENRFADLNYPAPATIPSEFALGWMRSTPLPTLRRVVYGAARHAANPFPFRPEPPAMFDRKFERLAQLPKKGGPLFVFAHLLLPHEPYVYDRTCRHLEPYWPVEDQGVEEPLLKAAYVEQIECLNRKLTRLVDRLIAESRQPPIIILQADHGHGRNGRNQPHLAEVPPDRAAERADIFAAYYVPPVVEAALHDSISPVNVSRALFSRLFDLPLPPLEDATYWSAHDRPYDFTRMEPVSAQR